MGMVSGKAHLNALFIIFPLLCIPAPDNTPEDPEPVPPLSVSWDEYFEDEISSIKVPPGISYFKNTIVSQDIQCFSARGCLIASPFISAKDADFITPHQEKPLSIIQNKWHANYQKALTYYLDKKDIVLNPIRKLQSIEAVKKSVMNGLGIATFSKFDIRVFDSF